LPDEFVLSLQGTKAKGALSVATLARTDLKSQSTSLTLSLPQEAAHLYWEKQSFVYVLPETRLRKGC
jgi:hypothetical protein